MPDDQKPGAPRRRKGARRIDPRDVPEVKRRIAAGENQHDIAADFGVNQGRISEINTGRKHAGIPAAI